MEIKRKRKNNYFSIYGNEKKKKKRLVLECGMKGFFCTCNFREKDCIREAYNLLNEYSEKLYSLNSKQVIDWETNVEEESSKEGIKGKVNFMDKSEQEEKDISSALNKELNELKAESSKPLLQRKFQVIDTGINNVIFIKSTGLNTLELLTAIVEDLCKNKVQKTRYLLRMLPVQVVCKANLDNIKFEADILFEHYFAQEPKTFCVIFNRRSNNNLHRNEIVEDLAEIILKKNPGNKANLKNPDIAVVIEIIRAVCLICIAPHYFVYKKYNLIEICNKNN